MALPLLPLLLLGGAGAAVFALSKSKAAPPCTVTVDTGMPASLRDSVIAEICYETNPDKLVALAAQVGPQYPLAAYELLHRAWVLRGKAGAEPQPPSQATPGGGGGAQPSGGGGAVPTGPAPAVWTCQMLDPGMSSDECQAVLNAIVKETDPTKLRTMAATFAPKYPIAAWVLNAVGNWRAGILPFPLPTALGGGGVPIGGGGGGQPAGGGGGPPVGPPGGGGPSTNPCAALASLLPTGVDQGIDSVTCANIVNELVNDNNPLTLTAFAATIARFPMAAAAVLAKATLIGQAGGGIPPVGPPPSTALVYPPADASTSTGKNAGRPQPNLLIILGTTGPGNAPVTIAQTGSGNANDAFGVMQQLNPQFKIGHDAEWIGLALNVPWAWGPNLARAGYVVQQDPGAGPQAQMSMAGLAHQATYEAASGVALPTTPAGPPCPVPLEGVGDLSGHPDITGATTKHPDITGATTKHPDITGADPSGHVDITGQAGQRAYDRLLAGEPGGPPHVEIVGDARAPERPKRGAHVLMRPRDRVYPPKLAAIGSAAKTSDGTTTAFAQLAAMNPHLVDDRTGDFRQFQPGDQVNVPQTWVTNLRQRGFAVRDEP